MTAFGRTTWSRSFDQQKALFTMIKRLITSAVLSLSLALSACRPPDEDSAPPSLQRASGPSTVPIELAEAQEIAHACYVWGFPIVEGYKSLFRQAVDRAGPEFRAGLNQIGNVANVASPADTSIITPNSDTPYSFLWMDLRTEPIIISVPKIESGRYFSVQLIDLYTFNFDYIHGEEIGESGSHFMVVGPDWDGKPPQGITRVIRSETQLAYGLFRTQLFSDDDIETVRLLQSQYLARPLSTFLGIPAPPPASPIVFPPYDEERTNDIAFFDYLNFLLQFMPTDPSEAALRARCAEIGVESGADLGESDLSPELREALLDGFKDAERELQNFVDTEVNPGKVTSAQLFGSRSFLGDNYLHRFAGAKLGIYGNSASEADYLSYFVDGEGRALDGAQHDYVLRFEANKLPPTHAFWSVTLYDAQTKLLSENEIDRYLINSAMLQSLVRDDDGAVSLYIQHGSPDGPRRANWLPAPAGPFYMVLRNYRPGDEVLSREWKKPPLARTR